MDMLFMVCQTWQQDWPCPLPRARNDRISENSQSASLSRPYGRLRQITVIAHNSRLAIQASLASDGMRALP